MVKSKIPNLTANFNKALQRLKNQAMSAVVDWVLKDMRAVSDKYTPEDEGDLVGSFFFERLTPTGNEFFRAQVGYGKNLIGVEGYNYAAELHEIPKRNYTKAGSGPRYLERALMETKAQLLPRVKAYTSRTLK